MKILAIGDFHGKIPAILPKIIKKERPDLIVSQGDFCGNEQYNKLFFRYSYATDKELWEIIGKRKTKELEIQNLNAGLKVIKKLHSIGLPIIAVTGNWDPSKETEIGHAPSKWKFQNKDLLSLKIKKFRNLKIINNKASIFGNLAFVGYPRSTYPGKSGRRKNNMEIKRDYKKHYEKLDKVFKKARQKNRQIIFISHNCPYNTRLDLIRSRKAHELARGKHYGSFLARKMIEKYRPLLCICGHMHENQGMQKLGKTTVINPGPAFRGRYAIIEIDKKANVRFKK